MSAFQIDLVRDEDRLGSLAMKFRGTRDQGQRNAIVDEYSHTVERLIHSGQWDEMPPPRRSTPRRLHAADLFGVLVAPVRRVIVEFASN